MIKPAITQELYDTIYFNLEKMGYTVYEKLPEEDVPYPFIVMGPIHKRHRNLKTAIGVICDVDIDVWGDSDSRFSVDSIIDEIDSVIRINTDNWSFIKRVNESDYQILHDNSTDRDLLHGVMSLVFESK